MNAPLRSKKEKFQKESKRSSNHHNIKDKENRRFHKTSERSFGKNTCPKPLKYSARANIPADEQFKKDIKAIKQKAERGFVEAVTKFHYRRLEKQKQKLRKEMSMANRKGRKESKNVNVSTTEDKEPPAVIFLHGIWKCKCDAWCICHFSPQVMKFYPAPVIQPPRQKGHFFSIHW